MLRGMATSRATTHRPRTGGVREGSPHACRSLDTPSEGYGERASAPQKKKSTLR